VDGLWATKSEGVGLIDSAISFQEFQPMSSRYLIVTDRRTDGRTTAISIPRYALVHRAVKTIGPNKWWSILPVNQFMHGILHFGIIWHSSHSRRWHFANLPESSCRFVGEISFDVSPCWNYRPVLKCVICDLVIQWPVPSLMSGF